MLSVSSPPVRSHYIIRRVYAAFPLCAFLDSLHCVGLQHLLTLAGCRLFSALPTRSDGSHCFLREPKCSHTVRPYCASVIVHLVDELVQLHNSRHVSLKRCQNRVRGEWKRISWSYLYYLLKASVRVISLARLEFEGGPRASSAGGSEVTSPERSERLTPLWPVPRSHSVPHSNFQCRLWHFFYTEDVPHSGLCRGSAACWHRSRWSAQAETEGWRQERERQAGCETCLQEEKSETGIRDNCRA